MNEEIDRKKRKTYFPFYIFITILLSGIGVTGFIEIRKAAQPTLAILSAILLATHIGLYWFNLKGFSSLRWWGFYYIAQALLITLIATLPYSGEAKSFGLNFLGSAIISIIAEAVGLWGNTRRAFFLGLFYLSLFFGILIKTGSDFSFPHLTQFFVNGGFIVILMMIFNLQLEERRKAEELAETLESANAKLAAYAARNESLTLQAERERMARELHDTLAQGLAGLILQLEALKAYQEQKNHEKAETVITQALDRARNTLSESRAAIEDLRNEDMGFTKAVEGLVAEFCAAKKTKCELNIQLDGRKKLPQNIQHHARRVLREALVNVQKHAQAKVASVSVIQSGKMLRLRIQDDGVGFNPEETPERGHFGLQGFQERAQLTNSQYHLVSSFNKGTTIEFIFSLNEGEGA